MSIRTVLAGALVATIAIGTPLLAIPAQAETLDVAACVRAHVLVEDDARAANTAADALAKAQKTLDAALKLNLDAAQKNLTAALNVVAGLDLTTLLPTDSRVVAVANAEAQVQAALKAIDNQAAPGPEATALKNAKDKLDRDLADAKSLCDRHVTTTTVMPTSTVAPTSTAAPTTVTATTTVTSTDGAGPIRFEPNLLPRGPVATGDGSTE